LVVARFRDGARNLRWDLESKEKEEGGKEERRKRGKEGRRKRGK